MLWIPADGCLDQPACSGNARVRNMGLKENLDDEFRDSESPGFKQKVHLIHMET